MWQGLNLETKIALQKSEHCKKSEHSKDNCPPQANFFFFGGGGGWEAL